MDLSPPLPPPRDRSRSMGYLSIPTSLLSRNSTSRQSVAEVASTLPARHVIGNQRRASETPYIYIDSSLQESSEGSDVDYSDGFSPGPQSRKLSLQDVIIPMLPQIMTSSENIHESLQEEMTETKMIKSVNPEHKFGEIKKSVTLSQNYKPTMSLFKHNAAPKTVRQEFNTVTANNIKNLQFNTDPAPATKPPIIETKPPEKKKPSRINRRDLNSFAPTSM